MRGVEEHRAGWGSRACGVSPLKEVYEELVEDYEGTAVAVLDYSGVERPKKLGFWERRLRKQADAVIEEWVRRYEEMAAIKHITFPLKDFRGVNSEYISRLEALGVKKAGQMLLAGQSPEKRKSLAEEAGIPEVSILELVKLSDLARLPGVKGIRARLYYDAGVDTVDKLAGWEPETLLTLTAEFVERAGFEGVAPLPKEVSSTIANARKLPKVVVW